MQNDKFKEKSKETCLEKYGFEYAMQSNEVKEKGKKTCLEKYGVEYSSQSIEIMEKTSKNAYKLKEFIFPSGRIEKLQGTEPYAITELLEKELINEDEIIVGVKNVPTIWYNDEN